MIVTVCVKLLEIFWRIITLLYAAFLHLKNPVWSLSTIWVGEKNKKEEKTIQEEIAKKAKDSMPYICIPISCGPPSIAID